MGLITPEVCRTAMGGPGWWGMKTPPLSPMNPVHLSVRERCWRLLFMSSQSKDENKEEIEESEFKVGLVAKSL